ncbi:MAG: hypothetical protein H6602_07625 [Flavobacteriales bacterium]|nr:hypothetical protein [Flavobacteriales bacterium]
MEPEKTLARFFDRLNARDYSGAYILTDHKDWGAYTQFREIPFWSEPDSFQVLDTRRKNYVSNYGGKVIVWAKFRAISKESSDSLYNYDFHFSEPDSGEWRIVRMTYPN